MAIKGLSIDNDDFESNTQRIDFIKNIIKYNGQNKTLLNAFQIVFNNPSLIRRLEVSDDYTVDDIKTINELLTEANGKFDSSTIATLGRQISNIIDTIDNAYRQFNKMKRDEDEEQFNPTKKKSKQSSVSEEFDEDMKVMEADPADIEAYEKGQITQDELIERTLEKNGAYDDDEDWDDVDFGPTDEEFKALENRVKALEDIIKNNGISSNSNKIDKRINTTKKDYLPKHLGTVQLDKVNDEALEYTFEDIISKLYMPTYVDLSEVIFTSYERIALVNGIEIIALKSDKYNPILAAVFKESGKEHISTLILTFGNTLVLEDGVFYATEIGESISVGNVYSMTAKTLVETLVNENGQIQEAGLHAFVTILNAVVFVKQNTFNSNVLGDYIKSTRNVLTPDFNNDGTLTVFGAINKDNKIINVKVNLGTKHSILEYRNLFQRLSLDYTSIKNITVNVDGNDIVLDANSPIVAAIKELVYYL